MSSPAQPIRIRPMVAEDVGRVMEIAKSLSQAPHWGQAVYLAAVDADAKPRRVALVAEDRMTGTIAGFAVASVTPPESELETIAVAEGFQRAGVARSLFAKLADELRRQGAGVTLLEVRASNEKALAFYRALGFAESGRRPRYYADPVEDAVLMRLALS